MQEIWSKLSALERFVVYGAVVVLVGWIVGEFIATISPCAGTGINCGTYSYFAAGNAGSFAILGLIAAIAAAVILALKVAPNTNITWPMPVTQIVLGVSVVTLACGLLVVLMQMSYGLGDAPVTMWIADLIFIGGGALQVYGAYMEYSKKPAA